MNYHHKDQRTLVILRSLPNQQGNVLVEYDGFPDRPWETINPNELVAIPNTPKYNNNNKRFNH